MLDKKTFTIGVLSLSAVILLVANILAPRNVAVAADSVSNNDYSLQTARSVQGGDALYITDNHTGQMAVFVFNPARHTLEAVDVQPVQNAFAKALNATGTGTGTKRPGSH